MLVSYLGAVSCEVVITSFATVEQEAVDSREHPSLNIRGGVGKGFVSDAVTIHSAARVLLSGPSPIRTLAGTHLYAHALFPLAKQGEQRSARSTRRLAHFVVSAYTHGGCNKSIRWELDGRYSGRGSFRLLSQRMSLGVKWSMSSRHHSRSRSSISASEEVPSGSSSFMCHTRK
jgi:hypothetical protein